MPNRWAAEPVRSSGDDSHYLWYTQCQRSQHRTVGVSHMTIHYSITPNEVTKSYIQQLRFSAAFRTRILLYAGLVGLIYFLPKLLRQEVRIFDIIMTFLLMLGLVVCLPFVLRLLTKPQQRILTINAQG